MVEPSELTSGFPRCQNLTPAFDELANRLWPVRCTRMLILELMLQLSREATLSSLSRFSAVPRTESLAAWHGDPSCTTTDDG